MPLVLYSTVYIQYTSLCHLTVYTGFPMLIQAADAYHHLANMNTQLPILNTYFTFRTQSLMLSWNVSNSQAVQYTSTSQFESIHYLHRWLCELRLSVKLDCQHMQDTSQMIFYLGSIIKWSNISSSLKVFTVSVLIYYFIFIYSYEKKVNGFPICVMLYGTAVILLDLF